MKSPKTGFSFLHVRLDEPKTDHALSYTYDYSDSRLRPAYSIPSGMNTWEGCMERFDLTVLMCFRCKGAIAVHAGKKVLISINMRDGSVIAVGKENPEWNYSAPHGAGGIMSRSKAKEMIGLEAYQSAMRGIYTTSVSESTIDEAPLPPHEGLVCIPFFMWWLFSFCFKLLLTFHKDRSN